ncbi:UDP-glucose/GDP-mannose dehydrogenase family protein [Candidatus Dojkabacteria bacterium]|nr:UDP-glucose/GDP-mannose dehydrogenase family protein [Candidatus Dojkabacteria bacterium]
MNISIVGTGYVGLTTGALLAAAGNKVYCIDVDPNKINVVKKGKSHFYEQGLDQFVKKTVDEGSLIPTLSYEKSIPDSEVAIICVGTPSKGDGSVDLSYVYNSTESIARNMKNGTIIVQKSTVPVGTGRRLQKIISRVGKKGSVVSCPEFLAEGSAVFDSLNMDRFVIGSESEPAKQKVIKLFQSLDDYSRTLDLESFDEFATIYNKKLSKFTDIPFEDRIYSMSLESAELVKVSANSFLTTKISFANSIAKICDKVGADINEVMDGIGADHRIGRAFLYAGLGWGGGCFPKDTAGLVYSAEEQGVDFKLLKSVVDVNNAQILYVVRKAKEMLKGELENKIITVLGLSFKPGTSDIRISPSIKLVKNLTYNHAKIRVYDPKAMENTEQELNNDVYFAKDIEDALRGTELAILATEWPEFIEMDFSSLKKFFKTPNLLDARNRWPKEKVKKLGFSYSGIGRS